MAAPNDRQLIESIHDDRLAELDEPAARATCEAIGARMRTEVEAASDVLSRAGIRFAPTAAPSTAQRHVAQFDMPDAATALRAADALAAGGFQVWEPMAGGAGRVQTRFRHVLTLARTSDVTVTIRLRWPRDSRRVPQALLPNQADFGVIDLPGALWPLYFVVRPLRLAAERVGLKRPAPPVLGPFLSTPDDLVAPLIDLAGITADDTVVDLGCGDARILVEAASRTGCDCIGIETDPTLVARAIARADGAGVGDHVTIVRGDAASADLSSASVVFVFLPADATVELVESLLARLTPGTRIVAHEQHRLPRQLPGATSTPLIRGQGVTVAHQWIVAR